MRLVVVLLALVGLIAAACGRDSNDASVAGTSLELDANDNTPRVSSEIPEEIDTDDADPSAEPQDGAEAVGGELNLDPEAEIPSTTNQPTTTTSSTTTTTEPSTTTSSVPPTSATTSTTTEAPASTTSTSETPAPAPAPQPVVRTGAGVLVDSGFEALAGKRVGLIANHTSTVDGTHLIDLLVEAPDVELVSVFAPEHGVRGNADAGELFNDEIDQATGTPIQSLYGSVRQPTNEMLTNIDVLVYDLQDVGTRTYTYISTMGLAMQSAAAADIEFVVLDRPNPLGNNLLDGFVLDEEQISFIGQYRIPLAYGLTVGELALALKADNLIGGISDLDLNVVTMQGWSPSMLWPETGLDWVAPSPGLPTFNAALAYPGTVLFEATSISYGTGGDYPFQAAAAPWANAEGIAEGMNRLGLPGVTFEPFNFTPTVIPGISPNPKLEGEPVEGVWLNITDRNAFRPVETAVYLLDAFYDQARVVGVSDNFIDRPDTMDLLAGTDRLRRQLDANVDPADIIAAWEAELDGYGASIENRRLYR